MNDDFVNFDPFDEDDLFDDEYAQGNQEYSSDNFEDDQEDLYEDLYEDAFDNSEQYEREDEESDAVTEYLRSKGIDARSIKFENESGEIDEVDFNDLTPDEQLQILQDKEETDDLSQDEISLLNQIRSNGWSVRDYNNYIAKMAIENYNNSNVNNYSVSNIGDDELFILDLEAKYPDISNEEKIEELEHAKANPALYNRKVNTLRNEYIEREKQMQQALILQRQYAEQQQMKQYVDAINNSILNNRYMDIGLSSEAIELSDQDMQDILTLLLGKDQAGNRHITNIFKNPDNLVKAVWYLSKGQQIGKDILDYYKHQITQARQNGYKKGYDDARAGRNISSKAVVSKRLNFPEKREQTIYDLD